MEIVTVVVIEVMFAESIKYLLYGEKREGSVGYLRNICLSLSLSLSLSLTLPVLHILRTDPVINEYSEPSQIGTFKN